MNIYQLGSQLHAWNSIDGSLVDIKALDELAVEAIDLMNRCDLELWEAGDMARSLYEPLSKDERQYFNGVLRETKFPSRGRMKSYWGPFKELLEGAEYE